MYSDTRDRIISRVLLNIGLDSQEIERARECCKQSVLSLSQLTFEGSNNDIKTKLVLARKNYLIGKNKEAAEYFGFAACNIINGMTTVYNYHSSFKPEDLKEYLECIHNIDLDAGYALFEAAIKDDPFSVEGEIDIDTVISAMEARKKADIESSRFAAKWFGSKLNISLDPADDLFMAYFYTYNIAKSVFADIFVPETISSDLQKTYMKKYHGSTDKSFTLLMSFLVISGFYLSYIQYSIISFMIFGFILFCSIPHYTVKINGKKGENVYVVAGLDHTYKFTTNIGKAWYKLLGTSVKE